MSNALMKRLDRIALMAGKDALLIYTHEAPDGMGGLILLDGSKRGDDGKPLEVGKVAAADVAKHLRSVIRIERSFGLGAA